MKHQLRTGKNVVHIVDTVDEAAQIMYDVLQKSRKEEKTPMGKVADIIRHFIELAKVADYYREVLARLTNNYLPSGSGFDSGTVIDIENSTEDRLVIGSAYHHMNDYGEYCGWSHFKVIVTFDDKGHKIDDIEIPIYGNPDDTMRDMDIDYWGEVFDNALNEIATSAIL